VQNDPSKYKNTWHTGPEMQVLDNDGHPDSKIISHRAGNLYDLIVGDESGVKPADAVESSRHHCQQRNISYEI